MSDRVSELPPLAGPLTGSEPIVVNQAGVTSQGTVQDIIDAVNTGAMVFRGTADASQADPVTATGAINPFVSGDMYQISVGQAAPHAFSSDGIPDDLQIGDFVVFNGVDWDFMNTNPLTAVEVKTLYESNADTNPFTDAQQTKLSGIETAATADQTGAEIKAAYEVEANAFTDTLFTKLGGIATGATANATDADLRDRSTHTGTQLLTTISDAGSVAALNEVAESNLSAAVQVKLNNSALNKFDGIVPPGVNDDNVGTGGNGIFNEGSNWVDTVGNKAYKCIDDAATAAIWIETTLSTVDLGTMATQNANAVSVTGGAISGLTSLGVAGNITLTGTVDGRDVATDGTKLDGISTGAEVNDANTVLAPSGPQILETITQAAYDLLAPPTAGTLYIVVG